jgi:hypothetical protein
LFILLFLYDKFVPSFRRYIPWSLLHAPCHSKTRDSGTTSINPI